MTPDDGEPGLVDTSHLTDADWVEINKLKRAWKNGGQKALARAMVKLAKDPTRYISVMAAYFPDDVRNSIKDQMADAGITEEDLRDLIRKLESPAGKQ